MSSRTAGFSKVVALTVGLSLVKAPTDVPVLWSNCRAGYYLQALQDKARLYAAQAAHPPNASTSRDQVLHNVRHNTFKTPNSLGKEVAIQ